MANVAQAFAGNMWRTTFLPMDRARKADKAIHAYIQKDPRALDKGIIVNTDKLSASGIAFVLLAADQIELPVARRNTLEIAVDPATMKKARRTWALYQAQEKMNATVQQTEKLLQSGSVSAKEKLGKLPKKLPSLSFRSLKKWELAALVILPVTAVSAAIMKPFGIGQETPEHTDIKEKIAITLSHPTKIEPLLKTPDLSKIAPEFNATKKGNHQEPVAKISIPKEVTKKEEAHVLPLTDPISPWFMKVTSPFDPQRFHPTKHIIRPHNGVDYAAPKGTPVNATCDATVAFAGRLGDYGKLIKLTCDDSFGKDTETRSAHLSLYAVKKGQHVSAGDIIGYSGASGDVSGAHLHYEIRINGTPVDPEKFMAEQEKRLAKASHIVKDGKIKLPGFTNGNGKDRNEFNVSPKVERAIEKAALKTGNSAEFLYRVYARESGLHADSCPSKSGPCGLAQFQPATFLEFVYKYKDELPQKHAGLYDQIKYGKATNWKYTVSDPAKKESLLDLRMNPDVAATLGGFHMNENFERVKKQFPDQTAHKFGDTEKYIGGHFLSVGNGTAFLERLYDSKRNNHAASDYMKTVATKNENIFYRTNAKGQMEPRSFQQIYDSIGRQISSKETGNSLKLSQNRTFAPAPKHTL